MFTSTKKLYFWERTFVDHYYDGIHYH